MNLCQSLTSAMYLILESDSSAGNLHSSVTRIIDN